MSDGKPTPLQRLAGNILRVTILLAAALAVWGVWKNLERYPRTEDAAVRANLIGVAPQVGGAITALHVTDNQRVKKGQLLVELDARPYRAEQEKAHARLELVKLEVRALEDQIAAAEAVLKERKSRAEYAASHYERLKPLLEGSYASPDRVQRAESEAAGAIALVREAEADVTRARNNLGEFEGKNTRIEEAQAALRDAELRASYCKIFAPCDGYVTNLQISPGAYAPTGGQIFSIVDDRVWFVLANFRETDLRRIRPGQQARIFLMSQRGRPVDGIVQGVARAVYPLAGPSLNSPGGEGVLPRVEPTFDFIQLAQRFPVRIVLEGSQDPSWRSGGKAAVVVDAGGVADEEKLRRLQAPELREFEPPAKNE